MIHVKYYLNGQVLYEFSEELATVNNLYDFMGSKKNTVVPLMNKQFISKGATYDLDTNTLEIVLLNISKFEHDIFYKDVSSILIEQLEYIGYVKSDICGSGKNIITNARQAKYYLTDNDYSNGGMGYVCQSAEQALAIAAIKKDTDENQWFIFPDEQIEYCECNSAVDEFGDFENMEEYPKKMTPEQILKHFN